MKTKTDDEKRDELEKYEHDVIIGDVRRVRAIPSAVERLRAAAVDYADCTKNAATSDMVQVNEEHLEVAALAYAKALGWRSRGY